MVICTHAILTHRKLSGFYNNVYHNLGQLIAWALSDKEDGDTLQCLWAVLKRRCPTAAVTCLMTDDDTHIYTNVTHISLHITHLLCFRFSWYAGL